MPSRVRLFATPWAIIHQNPLCMEFSRQEYWHELPFPPPGDLPDLGAETRSLALQADSLPPVFVQLLCLTLCDPMDCSMSGFQSCIISQRLLKLRSIESVMASNHLILCHPLLFLPSIIASIRVFSNELALRIGWPKYWSFSLSTSPSNEYSGS